MKFVLILAQLLISTNIFSDEFNNFIRLVNEKNNEKLLVLDHHAKTIGVSDFKNQYLTEISKELFGTEFYSANNNYIVSKKTYSSEKKDIFNKITRKHIYLIKQLCEDIESFIQGNQYSSLERFNNYPTTRLTRVVRANLKKVRLISKIWLFLQKSSAEKIENTLVRIINNAQKRVLLLASLSSEIPTKYQLSIFKTPPLKKTPVPETEVTKKAAQVDSSEDKALEEIIRDEETIKKADSKKQKNMKKEWKPKEEPSYTGLLNMFLNTTSQKQAKQAKYIAPKTLPKPSNDW